MKKNRLNKNTDRERAWRVMRIIRKPFTLKDIAKLSEAEVVNLKHYFCTLKKAGYIVVVGYKSMSPKPGQRVPVPACQKHRSKAADNERPATSV